jgi:hypothetical protein
MILIPKQISIFLLKQAQLLTNIRRVVVESKKNKIL